jgi:hypothetical protein
MLHGSAVGAGGSAGSEGSQRRKNEPHISGQLRLNRYFTACALAGVPLGNFKPRQKAFTADDALRHAAPNRGFEQLASRTTVAKAAEPIFGERCVVWHGPAWFNSRRQNQTPYL